MLPLALLTRSPLVGLLAAGTRLQQSAAGKREDCSCSVVRLIVNAVALHAAAQLHGPVATAGFWTRLHTGAARLLLRHVVSTAPCLHSHIVVVSLVAQMAGIDRQHGGWRPALCTLT